MSNIQSYNPINDLLSLREATGRLFEETLPRSLRELMRASGNLDLYETANGYEVHIPLAGAKPDEVDITISHNLVTVQWETSSRLPEGGNQLYRGIQHGRFQEQFTLPEEINADATGAHFENGILTIHMPKAEQSKSKKIKVTPS